MDELKVDPRVEADAQIARALQVVVDAGNPDDDTPARDYEPEELDTLFFSLSTALIQLKKVPGGVEARDRFYERAEDELRRRDRHDLLDKINVESKIDRIGAALDDVGVPRHAGPREPVSEGQPLPVESRVHMLCDEVRHLRGQIRAPVRHRRVQHLVAVKESELTEVEKTCVHPTGTPGTFEVLRWDDTDAVKAVKRAFGDNIDFSDGTMGNTLAKLMTVAKERDVDIRDELATLASKFTAR